MYRIDQSTAEWGSLAHIGSELMNAWNAHDVDQVMSFYSPHYEGVDVGLATPLHGPEEKRQTVVRYLLAFPDLRFTIEDVVAQEDRVAVSWIAQGTHRGHFMHIPPTNKPIHVRGVSMLTMQKGKIASAVYVWDVAGLLRNIGLLPEL